MRTLKYYGTLAVMLAVALPLLGWLYSLDGPAATLRMASGALGVVLIGFAIGYHHLRNWYEKQ